MQYDLGTYSCPVTTNSADAQAWFDQGLLRAYGYNHKEPVTCFEKAATADEALHIKEWLDGALARTDVPIKASCFSRKAAA